MNMAMGREVRRRRIVRWYVRIASGCCAKPAEKVSMSVKSALGSRRKPGRTRTCFLPCNREDGVNSEYRVIAYYLYKKEGGGK